MISPVRTQEGVVIPLLHHGDRMSLEEFERRWDAMPDLKHAELIEGQVYMNAAALRWDWHAEPHTILLFALSAYSAFTPGVRPGTAPSVRMEPDSMPQPDAVLRITEEYGGQTHLEKGYVVGTPEFLGEVSGSTEQHDLREKKALYLRVGVQEYLNWSVLDEQIVLFSLDAGSYLELATNEDGFLKSQVFPGLWFDPAALIRGDQARVLEVVQRGVQTPEHQAFVKELQNRRIQKRGNP